MATSSSAPSKVLIAAALLAGAALLWGLARRGGGEGPGAARPPEAIAGAPAEAEQAVAGTGLATPAEGGALVLPLDPKTPAEVREVVAFCEAASRDEAPDLRSAALEAENALVVGNALRALGRLGRLVGDEELLALLDDPRPRVRQEVVMGLAESGDPEAVEVLELALQSEDEALRPLAIRALGRIGGERARAVLEALSRDPTTSETERAFLRSALAASGG